MQLDEVKAFVRQEYALVMNKEIMYYAEVIV